MKDGERISLLRQPDIKGTIILAGKFHIHKVKFDDGEIGWVDDRDIKREEVNHDH